MGGRANQLRERTVLQGTRQLERRAKKRERARAGAKGHLVFWQRSSCIWRLTTDPSVPSFVLAWT